MHPTVAVLPVSTFISAGVHRCDDLSADVRRCDACIHIHQCRCASQLGAQARTDEILEDLRKPCEACTALQQENQQQADVILELQARLKQTDKAMAVQTVRNDEK